MNLEVAERIADAVLFEGYLLYPYRASAQKNQVRWQFGVLMPPSYVDEPSTAQTECLAEVGSDSRLNVRLRFLQVVATDRIDQGVTREVDLRDASLSALEVPFAFDDAVQGVLRVEAEPLEGPYPVVRLRLRVENTTSGSYTGRQDALRHALVATHLVFGIHKGTFISMIDPPEWARLAVAACVNERLWPVLVGERGRRDVMLSAPIILYDYPQIAPESQGDLFDATEIDEILTLRTMALTDAEKQEGRETDPRAAALIERVEAMPGQLLERLHGAVRYVAQASGERGAERPDVAWWDPGTDTSVSPATDALMINGISIAKGSRVHLTPGVRRADAHDMFLAGRTAQVEGVFLDVEGNHYLAVILEGDPGAELYSAYRRFLYFRPDEVEPL